MPIPANAIPVEQPLDPGDTLDFYAALSVGAQDVSPAPMLLTGETVAGLVVAVSSEAAAVGLKIMSGSGYPAPAINSSNVISFWLSVDAAMRSSTVFNDGGILLGVELTITTNNNPPRIKNRTLAVLVKQLPA